MKRTAILITLAICLFACRLSESGPTAPLKPSPAVASAIEATLPAPTQPPPATQQQPTFTPAPSQTPAFDPLSCIPAGRERTEGMVKYVYDGDTIAVDLKGISHNVRYIGIDAPEDTRTIEYFGAEATQRNRQLVAGKTVTLVKDVSESDRYGRLLSYVLVGSEFINYLLVLEGYAVARTYPPDVSCDQILRQAERFAREHDLGFWANNETETSQ